MKLNNLLLLVLLVFLFFLSSNNLQKHGVPTYHKSDLLNEDLIRRAYIQGKADAYLEWSKRIEQQVKFWRKRDTKNEQKRKSLHDLIVHILEAEMSYALDLLDGQVKALEEDPSTSEIMEL
jgi:hypothetical protein